MNDASINDHEQSTQCLYYMFYNVYTYKHKYSVYNVNLSIIMECFYECRYYYIIERVDSYKCLQPILNFADA